MSSALSDRTAATGGAIGERTATDATPRTARGVWVFPAVVVLSIAILGALRISGTSIGLYHDLLYGGSEDPALVAVDPQAIRSDEYRVNTQLTIVQARDGFPLVNENIAGGRDMSLIVDVPYRDWSTAFRPQNLPFFVLPLDVAFALKWWMLEGALLLGAYAFALRLLPGRPALSAGVALSAGLSPFVAWWYWGPPVLTLAYGFALAVLGSRIIRGDRIRLPRGRALTGRGALVVHALATGYLAACFALLMYPPFQVPVVLAVVAWLAGDALAARWGERVVTTGALLRHLGVLGAAGLGAVGVIGLFALTRRDALAAVLNTVYPGARSVQGGGYPVNRLFDTFLQPQLQRDLFPFGNMSESAAPLLLLPYLLPVGIVLLVHARRRGRAPDWRFVALHAVTGLFLAYLFVPWLQPLYEAVQLDLVPLQRMVGGLAFVGTVYLAHVVRELSSLRADLRMRAAGAAWALVCGVALLAVGYWTMAHYPQFVSTWNSTGVYAALFAGVLLLLMLRSLRAALALLAVYSFLSVYLVHPLYRGLGPLAATPVLTAIDEESGETDTWAVIGPAQWENLALLAGERSVSGVHTYPDVDYWDDLDDSAAAEVAYNRYAHVLFTADPAAPDIALTQQDEFTVAFECSPWVRGEVTRALSVEPLDLPCVEQLAVVRYPTTTFYLYDVR